ncbi:hypothetical protein AMELA_G00071820 [Ameiurus melas]|uniref:Uncharacterized protein n=1 Tax=Ameiurus melas TaxID=219545 RepID=A0A7J6AXX0_AMEME|nr:hypothetical protein AMELA_G00071820 [Ameiurus melas]
MREISEKCFYELKSTNGRVVYESGEIRKYDLSMKQVDREARDRPCGIIITDGEKITNGLGCYYGCGRVLTTLHVENTRLENADVLIAFPNGKHALIYKAEFTNSCNTDTDRDQAFIKLLGDTSPLCDGLQNQISTVKPMKMKVYIFTP